MALAETTDLLIISRNNETFKITSLDLGKSITPPLADVLRVGSDSNDRGIQLKSEAPLWENHATAGPYQGPGSAGPLTTDLEPTAFESSRGISVGSPWVDGSSIGEPFTNRLSSAFAGWVCTEKLLTNHIDFDAIQSLDDHPDEQTP